MVLKAVRHLNLGFEVRFLCFPVWVGGLIGGRVAVGNI